MLTFKFEAPRVPLRAREPVRGLGKSMTFKFEAGGLGM